MAGLFPNAAEGIVLDLIVNKGTYEPEDLVLRLFQNNYTPVDGSVVGNFTEADFTGYSAATLTGANWTITTGAPSYADYAKQTFTSTLDQTLQYIYGYYITRSIGGELVCAEKFTDGPYAIVNNLDYIEVTPKLYAKKQGE